MPDSIKRETILVLDKNKKQIESYKASGDIYRAFEAAIPLSLIEYREFEGRVKKLVYDNETVSVRQLQYVLAKDYDDFVELADPESPLSTILTGELFKPKNKQSDEESKEELDHMDRQIDIVKLLLFGLLYCKGTHEVKCDRFWDILQQPGLDQISWQDKELTVAGTWMLEMAGHWTHTWSIERYPDGGSKVKEFFSDMSLIKDLSDEIYQNMLDDIFGNKSRVERNHFLDCMKSKCKYLFDPEQLREKIID